MSDHVFVSGVPGSGITWLMAILDSHPQISCCVRQDLAYLWRGVDELAMGYNRFLVQANTHRVGHQVDGLHAEDVDTLFRQAVEITLRRASPRRDIQWYGTCDCAMLADLQWFRRIYPHSRLFVMVRDPRDVCVSIWHYYARTKAGFRRDFNSPAQWAVEMGRTWGSQMEALRVHEQSDPNLTIVRYEDLCLEPSKQIERIYSTLDATDDPDFIRTAEVTTSFHSLASRAQGDRDVFRRGVVGHWRDELDKSTANSAFSGCSAIMEHFGYR